MLALLRLTAGDRDARRAAPPRPQHDGALPAARRTRAVPRGRRRDARRSRSGTAGGCTTCVRSGRLGGRASPCDTSLPTGRMSCAGAAALRISTRRVPRGEGGAAAVSSTCTTASAPSGTGAPVVMYACQVEGRCRTVLARTRRDSARRGSLAGSCQGRSRQQAGGLPSTRGRAPRCLQPGACPQPRALLARPRRRETRRRRPQPPPRSRP